MGQLVHRLPNGLYAPLGGYGQQPFLSQALGPQVLAPQVLAPQIVAPQLFNEQVLLPYELDLSGFLAGLEDSIRATEEDSVVVAAADRTSLLLRPVAKAVAGPRGVAVASPVAKAVITKGQPVTVDFDPDAVAIAGPGGSAEAHPKLVISYATASPEDAPSSTPQSADVQDNTGPTDDVKSSQKELPRNNKRY